MLTFALAVFLLIATPGPGVLSTAGVGSAFGWRPGLSYVTGLWAGTNLVSLAIITMVYLRKPHAMCLKDGNLNKANLEATTETLAQLKYACSASVLTAMTLL